MEARTLPSPRVIVGPPPLTRSRTARRVDLEVGDAGDDDVLLRLLGVGDGRLAGSVVVDELVVSLGLTPAHRGPCTWRSHRSASVSPQHGPARSPPSPRSTSASATGLPRVQCGCRKENPIPSTPAATSSLPGKATARTALEPGVFAQRFAPLAVLDIGGDGQTAALTDGLLGPALPLRLHRSDWCPARSTLPTARGAMPSRSRRICRR
jgi:hypothetical protein